jgi:membrane protease YdiL (CAAX protease family)
MNPFDENPSQPPNDQPVANQSSNTPREESPQESPQESPKESIDQLSSRIVVHPAETESVAQSLTLAGDPIPYAAGTPAPPPPPANSFLPEDLRISWSWVHLLFFGLFAFGSILVIQVALIVYFTAGRHLNQKEIEQLFQNRPDVAVGSNVLWFLLIFLFLYLTIALLQSRPFWATLGWKKLGANPSTPTSPWIYFSGGIGLAVCVAIISLKIKTPEHLPIQDLFKNRTGALLLMGMAVLVAPLVEETVFRGYLYPLFASTSARIAKRFGADPAGAVQAGTRIGIVLTGTLFGLLHGAQLGWTWALVAVLSTVGIIFTFVRARAGTVLASFLLHLGYNSFIAFSAIVSTRGFTQIPPHP